MHSKMTFKTAFYMQEGNAVTLHRRDFQLLTLEDVDTFWSQLEYTAVAL